MMDILLGDPRINVNHIVGGDYESCPLMEALKKENVEDVDKFLLREDLNINITIKGWDYSDLHVDKMLMKYLEKINPKYLIIFNKYYV